MSLGLILDLVVLGIIALCVFLSAKHGFVRTVLELAGLIAAFVIAFSFSSPLANITYDKIIEPSMVSKIEKTSAEGEQAVATKLWDSMPGIVKNNSSTFGLSKEKFDDKVSSKFSSSVSDSAQKISESVLKPLITRVLSAFYSTVLVIVLIIVFKFLAKVINKLFKFSFIGKINAFLGGVIGAFKGIAIATLFCIAVSLIISVTGKNIWVFSPENIDSSHLFKFLYGFSPFI